MNPSPAFHRRISAFLGGLVPIVFLFAVYWYGLKNWFEQDDFAWLALHHQSQDFSSFLTTMFQPMAQGTIRPWSERGFFLLFYRLFEADALPYHIAVFVTQSANLVLLSMIVWRLTASRVAAAAAPLLWTANSVMITPLCWVSDYNQIQCAFFLLLAFLLYLQGRYWMQVAVFVLGFGALELNIVYPALVLAYVLLTQPSRKRILQLVPLFAISAAYFLLHSALAPTQKTGVYALHFDRALPATLWTYWNYAFTPEYAHQPFAALAFFTVAVLAFVLYEAVKGRKLPLFFLLWFLITLAPLLPLRDHISDYYLAIPALGLGTVLALALIEKTLPVRLLGLTAAAFYLFIQIPVARFGTQWYMSHTRPVRTLVAGVRQARQLHPGKAILVTDVSDDLYLDSFAHSVFRALDIDNVYLAPELLPTIVRLNPTDKAARSVAAPPGAVIHALLEENLIVYSAAGVRLKNVTSVYEKAVEQRYGWNEEKNVPQTVDAGAPLLAYLLGSAWYPPVGSFRWMPSRASFRIGGPRTANERLTITGNCPREQTESGPLTLSVSVDGKLLSEAKISKPETSFSRSFSLPPELLGHPSVEVLLAVDKTLEQPAGSPPLGLAFGVFEIH